MALVGLRVVDRRRRPAPAGPGALCGPCSCVLHARARRRSSVLVQPDGTQSLYDMRLRLGRRLRLAAAPLARIPTKPVGFRRHADPALAPRRARGRVDPHLPRGRGRVREAGAALLRRQGLDGDAAPRREGVLARPHPVPADARRHRPQLRRGARLPRPPGRRARRPAGGRVGPGRRSTPGRVVEETGPAGQPQPAPDRHPARRDHRATASTRCSAAAGATRRRPGPRSGCTRSATTSGSGTRRTSGPSCGTSTTAGTARASTSACSRCRTGPSSTSGSTSRTTASSCRRSTTRTGARCSAATACCSRCRRSSRCWTARSPRR